MSGLVVDDNGVELLVGDERVGPRRPLGDSDVALLSSLGTRYQRATAARAGSDLVELGRELWRWLDGDGGGFSALLERSTVPLVFAVRGPRAPSDRVWAVLRAPFELLARPGEGFLADDELLRFCVVRRLGTPAQPAAPDGFRLGLAFMASSPPGRHELDFEAEEAAILSAVGESRIDLLVDDTGDPEQLGHRLADAGGMPVVHLSCHGTTGTAQRPGTPALLMEDELGGVRPTTAAELVGLLPDTTRLVFVSACLTASTAEPPVGGARPVAHSLATALVAAGVPAVIGWDGSVDDRAATAFAERLYRALSDRADLAVAVGDARRALLRADDDEVRADWHRARLWLGPQGGGRLVAGTRRRSVVSATHGTRTFLDRRHQVPVAAAGMFVGRRPELQQALRALRSGDRAGVLLHGLGRLGKSSLAARIADRCPDHAVAVVHDDYSATAVLDAVAEAVRANPEARELVERRRPEVRHRPEALGPVLVDLAHGPCAGGAAGQQPLLLVVDDLEQILVSDPTGPHRVAAEHAPTLAAVLRAFDPELPGGLLVTSRFTFTLDGLEARLAPVQLRSLSDVGRRKLHRRQQAVTPAERQAERADLARRAVTATRGNPGLQDLVVLGLVYGEGVSLPRAEAAVTGLETYLARGDAPADDELRAYLEKIALDALLVEAGPAHLALLGATTLFDLPVPEPVVDVLAAAVGGTAVRLRGLGLLDPHRDPYDPARQALATNPLAAGRVAPLGSGERAALAAEAVGPLLDAWGGPTAGRRRTGALDLQLTRLGLAGDDRAVVATCATAAVWELRRGRAVDALRLAHEAIALLDQHDADVPLELLRAAADAAFTSGDGAAGEALLDRAARRADADDSLGEARVLADRARHLVAQGELEEAEQLFRRAHGVFAAGGSAAEAAAVLSGLADIALRRGDHDEARHILRDKVLPVYEALGDDRAAAVTRSRIADIAFRRGEHDEALRIYRDEVLPVHERLGDTRSTAITWGRIADVAFERGDHDEALRIRREVELPEYELLGDVRAVAVTWGRIADVAFARGEHEEALHIRRTRELPVHERLGDVRETARCQIKIGRIAHTRGHLDEAAQMHRTALDAIRTVGDAEVIAEADWELARVDLARGDHAAARPLLVEAFELLRRLGRPDGIAAVGFELGRLQAVEGRFEDARRTLRESLAAAARLGLSGRAARITELLRRLEEEDPPT